MTCQKCPIYHPAFPFLPFPSPFSLFPSPLLPFPPPFPPLPLLPFPPPFPPSPSSPSPLPLLPLPPSRIPGCDSADMASDCRHLCHLLCHALAVPRHRLRGAKLLAGQLDSHPPGGPLQRDGLGGKVAGPPSLGVVPEAAARLLCCPCTPYPPLAHVRLSVPLWPPARQRGGRGVGGVLRGGPGTYKRVFRQPAAHLGLGACEREEKTGNWQVSYITCAPLCILTTL